LTAPNIQAGWENLKLKLIISGTYRQIKRNAVHSTKSTKSQAPNPNKLKIPMAKQKQ
jgi:hypothetical protein